MKQAEMQWHRETYDALLVEANRAEEAGQYQLAIEHALKACRHADGMMRHREKTEGYEFASISAIELVLRYAPLLLDAESIDAVEQILRGTRRIERKTAADEKAMLAGARAALDRCHRLWHHLEDQADDWQASLRQRLGGQQEEWRKIAEAWEKMGLLRRAPRGRSYSLRFSTHLDEVIDGKCPSCGLIAQAPKAMLLEATKCPECGERVLFVLLEK